MEPRRRNRFLAFLVAVIVAGGLALGGPSLRDALRDHPVVGSISWRLVDMSADARSLTIEHEVPHCTTEPGDPVVRENATRVEVTIPEVQVRFGKTPCDIAGQTGRSTVRLAAPLAGRDLRQPAPRGEDTAMGTTDTIGPGTPQCADLAKLPAAAPAREVPWVVRRLRICGAAPR